MMSSHLALALPTVCSCHSRLPKLDSDQELELQEFLPTWHKLRQSLKRDAAIWWLVNAGARLMHVLHRYLCKTCMELALALLSAVKARGISLQPVYDRPFVVKA